MKKKRRRMEKIAVIEEVADNIYSIKFILQSLGYEVNSFSCASGYLKDLEDFEPKLVVVDMMIPHRIAYAVIREVTATLPDEVPVVAITADAMEGEAADVFEAGGQDILAKPYSVAELQEKLKKWLPCDGLPV